MKHQCCVAVPCLLTDCLLLLCEQEGEAEFARSMRTILSTPLKDLMMDDGYSLTRQVSSTQEVGLGSQTIDLVLGGADLELTDENKAE